MRPVRPRPVRDQVVSNFSLILEDLILAVPFVQGAAVYDFEGESIDYAGELDPFELKVTVATIQLIICEMRECARLSSASELCIRTPKFGYVIRPFDDGYGLLCMVRPMGTGCVSSRVLDEVCARLQLEAGLTVRQEPGWYQVEIEAEPDSDRPRRLRPAAQTGQDERELPWVSIEVLGALVGLQARERAYRVRLANGAEVTLLRETRRLWFIDAALDLSNSRLVRGASIADVFSAPPKAGNLR